MYEHVYSQCQAQNKIGKLFIDVIHMKVSMRQGINYIVHTDANAKR
jgi:hypothetical protein